MQKERIVGGGVLALGLLLFFVLIPFGIDSPEEIDHMTLSPDFWPRIISIMFALMGLLTIIRPGEIPADAEDEIDPASWPARLPRLAVVLIVLFLFYFLIDHLGMVVPGIVVIFGMMWFAGERRYLMMTITAVIVPTLLYIFFVHVANIPIPLGIFESIRG